MPKGATAIPIDVSVGVLQSKISVEDEVVPLIVMLTLHNLGMC